MPMSEQSEEQPADSALPEPKKRKRSRREENGERRCTNASDVWPAAMPTKIVKSMNLTYEQHVTNLENRIQHLEQELLRTRSEGHGEIVEPPDDAFHEQDIPTTSFGPINGFSERAHATAHPHQDNLRSPPSASSIIVNVQHSQSHKFPVLEPEVGTSSPILIYGAHAQAVTSIDPPEEDLAQRIVERAYSYVQARYCIVDWVQLREWHQRRDSYLDSAHESDAQSQTPAFFIWMIYAIGARFVPELGQECSEAYFARASKYLPAVLGLQDMFTVQALLCMIQFSFRAPKGPSLWDLTRMVVSRYVEEPVNIDDACTDQGMIEDLQKWQAKGMSKDSTRATTMSSALQHLTIYRIRSAITSRFTGPSAEVPSYSDVQTFLAELNEWRDHFPKAGEPFWSPQQPPERVQATYLQAVLVLIRPVLLQADIDPPLLSLCANFAAEACESGRTLSLDSQTFPDRITVFHCFFCGVTLLQCLTVDPRALPRRRTHQAISSCLSSLTVYSRALPAVTPFLHLYDELANRFFGDEDDEAPPGPNPELRKLLSQVILSDPSETPELLRSLRPSATGGANITEAQLPDEYTTAPQPGGIASKTPAENEDLSRK
ncbi:hypothetical protein PRZ48_012878 [Zasmidium cellare]|uniref:Xylanolytic transcriptional activator regulatory domain-containing protein n=1 Tax=Zasmidium cellare TaxID=395010 RepID=A0ABR0E2U7_ZASCE|nr:hypothetical protein PRZ48_012878 [Zasmidium cellare]